MQAFLAARGERFCLIGGLALQRWGEPRVTRDVDVTLLTPLGAEDLVVLKVFAGRGRDWVDLERVVVRQRKTLDWQLVFREIEPLAALRETPEAVDRLRQLKERIEKGA